MDVEVDAVALRGRVRDTAPVAREIAERAERLGGRQQLALAPAIGRDEVEAFALVAVAIHAIHDPLAGRRPAMERDGLSERELARPAPGRIDHPELR